MRTIILALLLLSSCCKEETQPICGEVVFTVWSPSPQPRYVAVRVPPSTSLTYLDISQEQYDQASAGDLFCGPLWCCGEQPSASV